MDLTLCDIDLMDLHLRYLERAGVESYREQRAYQVAPGVPARGLESTAAPANVHWIKDADVLPSRQTPGGGSQTAIPYNQHAGITPSA